MSKEIREILKGGDVKFTIKDNTTYSKGENGEYGYNLQVFKVDKEGLSISGEFGGMNVTKWGPSCVTLYSYNMLSKRTIGKINYKDITITEIEVACSASLDNEWYYE
tara:strand:+ start:50 stop:370 length:321 start_codon:yes stop_codon:yes gene_type:complete